MGELLNKMSTETDKQITESFSSVFQKCSSIFERKNKNILLNTDIFNHIFFSNGI